MISSMESQIALTIMDQQGTNLRVPRTHPSFDEVKRLLRDSSEPSCVVIEQIKTLVADPIETLLRWCARMGFPLKRIPAAGEIDVSVWAPYLNRLMRAGSTPEVAMVMARMVPDPSSIDQSKICVHWMPAKATGGNTMARFIYQRPLPAAAQISDGVSDLSKLAGPVIGLVSTMRPWDGVSSLPGQVMQLGSRDSSIEQALAEPAILGNEMTYRIEEASPAGWLQESSYDSIARAKIGLDLIRATGDEARLVNRSTGVVIDV